MHACHSFSRERESERGSIVAVYLFLRLAPYSTTTVVLSPPLAPAMTMTIGTRIDQALASLSELTLSSTQLYTLIVGLTVLVSVLLLGNAPQSLPETALYSATTATTAFKNSNHNKLSSFQGPEPRWHLFRYFNYAVVALFSWSVLDFGWHVKTYMNDSSQLLQFLVGWSVCLCYFFGFFGVSFVYNSEDEEAETDERREEAGNNNATENNEYVFY